MNGSCGDHIADHEHAIGLAPEDDVAGRVAGYVDHPEAGDVVAVGEAAVDRVAAAEADR